MTRKQSIITTLLEIISDMSEDELDELLEECWRIEECKE